MGDGSIQTNTAKSHRSVAYTVKPPRPGPGSHDITQFPDVSPVVPSAAAFSIGSGREDRAPRKARAGPGSYYPKLDLTTPKQSCYGFGRSRRLLGRAAREGLHDTPAPRLVQGDTNDLGSGRHFTKAPSFGFGSENRFSTVIGDACNTAGRGTKMPGPGEHNPDDHFSSKAGLGPSFSVTLSRRDNAVKKQHFRADGPGPGEYKVADRGSQKYKTAPSFGFGTTARPMGCHAKSKLPGPGTYSTLNATRTGHNCVGGPKWSMRGRQELDVALQAMTNERENSVFPQEERATTK